MGTRLNADIRGQILTNVWRGQFKPRYDAQKLHEQGLCREVYGCLVPPEEREMIEKLTVSKRGWFNFYSYLNVVTRQGYMVRLDCNMDVPHLAQTNAYSLHGDRFAGLSDAVTKAAEALADLKTADKKAMAALKTALNKVTTFENLVKQWPEGSKYYTAPPLEKPLTLPAVRFSDVNTMLGMETA